MMNTLKEHRKLFIIIAIAVVAVLVAVITFFAVKNNQPETIEDKISKSTVGTDISEVTTVNGEPAASIVVAPPSQKWWDTLLGYSTNPTLKDLNFDDYDENADYVAFTMSPGNNFQSQGVLGLPTTFIVYENEDSATKVADFINSRGGLGFQQVGNMILFIQDGAYSDVNYAVDQFDNTKDRTDNADLELNDTAFMAFNFKSFTSLYAAGLNDNDSETVDTTLALLGMTNQTVWSGTSKDGLTWDGTFSNTDFKQPNTPTSIRDYLSGRSYYLDVDGSVKLTSEATDTNQTGVQYPAQSILISSGGMSVRSNEEAVGVDAEGTPIKALPASEGLYQVSVDLNRWLTVMRSGDVVYSYTGFQTLTATVKDATGKSTIVLEPITDENYLNDNNNVEETPSE
jgi:hypothetical protein